MHIASTHHLITLIIAQITEEFIQKHPFEPKLNSVTEDLAENMFYGLDIGFLQRQELFRAAKRKREEEVRVIFV